MHVVDRPDQLLESLDLEVLEEDTADCVYLANSKQKVLCTLWVSNYVMVNSVQP